MTFKRPTVFLGLSGGVDSSVAAALLLEQGYDVIPVFLKCWENIEALNLEHGTSPQGDCPWQEDQDAAYAVAEKLGIADKFRSWNFSEEFFETVVQYLIGEAREGRTGNPDVICNRTIKFGAFLERALNEGADFVATGHYARVSPARFARGSETQRLAKVPSATMDEGGLPKGLQSRDSPCFAVERTQKNAEGLRASASVLRWSALMRPLCEAKNDQTYFLWQLNQEQLSRSLFPIGEFESKEAVRKEARQRGLPTAERKSTRGICFVSPKDGYAGFLQRFLPIESGEVVTSNGEVVGRHEGLAFYTIGQRQGIGLTKAHAGPYYVIEKDRKQNRLVVAPPAQAQRHLWQTDVRVDGVNWISGREPELPLHCEAFIRHPQDQTVRCLVERINTNEKANKHKTIFCVGSFSDSCAFRVAFERPQYAPTPGQSVVFYDGDLVLGGGEIAMAV